MTKYTRIAAPPQTPDRSEPTASHNVGKSTPADGVQAVPEGQGAGLVGVKETSGKSALPPDAARLAAQLGCSQVLEIQPHRMRQSRRNAKIKLAAVMHNASVPKGWHAAMITPTLAPGIEYEARMLSDLLMHVRKWFDRKGLELRFYWIAEPQERGAIHWHLVFWMPRWRLLPMPDKQGWWPSGMSRIEWLKDKTGIGYALKYLSKEMMGELPKGARCFGHGGLSQDQKKTLAWETLPRWLRRDAEAAGCTQEDRLKRAPGGGWLSRLTGEWFASPWIVVRAYGKIFAIDTRSATCPINQ